MKKAFASPFMQIPTPLLIKPESIELLDCRLIPDSFQYLSFKSISPLAQALRDGIIYGPGLVPVVAACGLALEAQVRSNATSQAAFNYSIMEALLTLKAARPESHPMCYVLGHLNTIARRCAEGGLSPRETAERYRAFADELFTEIFTQDMQLSGEVNALINANATVMVIGACGKLSSVGCGSILSGIIAAQQLGKNVHVTTPISAPICSGPRFTRYEMQAAGVDCEVISDGGVATTLFVKRHDAVFFLANRIAMNGTVSAPIGATAAAAVAKAMGIPVYAVAYTLTAAPQTPNGNSIPIEEHQAVEIPVDTLGLACSPIVDLVPAEWITGYVTPRGLIKAKTPQAMHELVETLAHDAHAVVSRISRR